MKKEMKLLGFYNYTVVLTYLGMLTGFLGILYALERNYSLSIMCLMAAGVCDMFDGAVASTRERTKQEKFFGIQIDSMSDLICFGVLPATLVYSMDSENAVIAAVACFYVLCALIRLAYFNVDEQERQEKEEGSRSIYYGLPVTVAALIIPCIYAVSNRGILETEAILTAVLGDMGIFFLIPFRLKKPKVLGKACILLAGITEFVFVLLTFGDLL